MVVVDEVGWTRGRSNESESRGGGRGSGGTLDLGGGGGGKKKPLPTVNEQPVVRVVVQYPVNQSVKPVVGQGV